jgi:hypothetical protein
LDFSPGAPGKSIPHFSGSIIVLCSIIFSVMLCNVGAEISGLFRQSGLYYGSLLISLPIRFHTRCPYSAVADALSDGNSPPQSLRPPSSYPPDLSRRHVPFQNHQHILCQVLLGSSNIGRITYRRCASARSGLPDYYLRRLQQENLPCLLPHFRRRVALTIVVKICKRAKPIEVPRVANAKA